MKNLFCTLIIIVLVALISCSEDSRLKDHMLIGNYTGSWDSNPQLEIDFSIEYEDDGDRLVLFFSLYDSSDLNVLSDTEFSIDRYEKNGYSNGVSGVLVEDTIFMQNEVYLVGDQQNTEEIRTGAFVKQ